MFHHQLNIDIIRTFVTQYLINYFNLLADTSARRTLFCIFLIFMVILYPILVKYYWVQFRFTYFRDLRLYAQICFVTAHAVIKRTFECCIFKLIGQRKRATLVLCPSCDTSRSTSPRNKFTWLFVTHRNCTNCSTARLNGTALLTDSNQSARARYDTHSVNATHGYYTVRRQLRSLTLVLNDPSTILQHYHSLR